MKNIRKKILVFCDFGDIYALKGLNILLKSKYFRVKCLIVTKKNRNIKKTINKKIKIFYDGFPHKNKKIISYIKSEKIELAFCTGFPNRVRKNFISLFEEGIINSHPSVLPYNKGSHSSFYTIINNTPVGASLHYMNESFDSGAIIDVIKIKSKPDYKAYQIFEISRNLCNFLLNKNLKKIYENKINFKNNIKNKINFKKDIDSLTLIKKNKNYSGEYIWRLLRAVNYKDNGIYYKINKAIFKITSKIKKIN